MSGASEGRPAGGGVVPEAVLDAERGVAPQPLLPCLGEAGPGLGAVADPREDDADNESADATTEVTITAK